MDTSALFTPFEYKGLKIKNRFVMAPMTRMFSPDGVPTAQVAEYYGRRAAAGVGLILTEGTVIDRPSSKNGKDVPHFHGTQSLAAWEKVVDSVHGQGGAIAPQIWHVGNFMPPDFKPAAPAETAATMSREDIEATIAAFGRAAGEAKRLGFNALEIHGAHGYLIDQFFWDKTNPRTDKYGGKTLAARTRFGADVVRAMRRAVGPDFPIILRISQWKGIDYTAKMALSPAELEAWVSPLAEAGVDIFHASQRRYWEPEFEGSDLNFGGWIKKITGQPVITVGSVGLSSDVMGMFNRGEGSGKNNDLTDLLRRFDRGDFDLVAVGRALLQDPEWVRKLQEQRYEELADFDTASLSTLY